MPLADGIATSIGCFSAHLVATTNSGASSSGGGGMGGVSHSPFRVEEEVEPSSRGEASGGVNVPLPLGSTATGGDSKRSGNGEAPTLGAAIEGAKPSTGNGIAILHRQSVLDR